MSFQNMPKTILTEQDIDAFKQRGATEICTNDEIYLTDLAFERAEKLGLPIRNTPSATTPVPSNLDDKEKLVLKVKAGVIARLGSDIDEKQVEAIVRRVVSQL